jgi:phenylpropionate dioxygenase-like ring-hydroxylating dioxygenase large terminal subunit
MVVSQKYDILSAEGLLDRSVFVSEEIYQEELEKVFGRAWLFIGHDSLIPNPNDFFLTYMGEDPVILTRDAKGEIHAFLNMCRHRGNRIVRADDGNAKNFMCAYHGWTYSNEGKLVSVPGLQEAYYGELDVDSLGLVSVAHLESYAGLVFATWADDAPALEEYLGDARWYLDITYNHMDGGIQAIGPVKWRIPANWKVPVDNASGDMYHAVVSHRSASLVQNMYKGNRLVPMAEAYRQPGRSAIAANGHAVLNSIVSDDEKLITDLRNRRVSNPDQKAWTEHIRPEMERRLGGFRTKQVTGLANIFPNYFLGMRLSHPRGPRTTECWTFEFYEKNAPDAIKALVRERSVQGAGQPGGMLMQDDMDNWRGVTDSGRLMAGRKVPMNMSMGMGHQSSKALQPALHVADAHCSELNQRSYYTRWQEFMNADSWADIHIDPITAKFEGSATMRG